MGHLPTIEKKNHRGVFPMFLVPTSWRPQVEDHKPLAGLMHLRADREEDSPMVKSQLRNEIPKVVKTTFFAGETW